MIRLYFAVILALASVTASQEEVIDDILNSLSKSTAFLESEHENINLDGVSGFVYLQGRMMRMMM